MNGINAIPRTHNGEGLAYISPGEAIWLRQRGGGVPPNDPSGQITKFGIPSFQAPDWFKRGEHRDPSSPHYQPSAVYQPPAPVAPAPVA